MKLKKFFIIAAGTVAATTLGFVGGTVFGYKHADEIDERAKALEEKMKSKKNVLDTEEIEEVVNNVTNSAKEVVNNVKDEVAAAVQPRGKDGKFVKKS